MGSDMVQAQLPGLYLADDACEDCREHLLPAFVSHTMAFRHDKYSISDPKDIHKIRFTLAELAVLPMLNEV
jgi:hypothetical protein